MNARCAIARGDGVSKTGIEKANRTVASERKIFALHTPFLEKRKLRENFFVAKFCDSESAKHVFEHAERFALALNCIVFSFMRVKKTAGARGFLAFCKKRPAFVIVRAMMRHTCDASHDTRVHEARDAFHVNTSLSAKMSF